MADLGLVLFVRFQLTSLLIFIPAPNALRRRKSLRRRSNQIHLFINGGAKGGVAPRGGTIALPSKLSDAPSLVAQRYVTLRIVVESAGTVAPSRKIFRLPQKASSAATTVHTTDSWIERHCIQSWNIFIPVFSVYTDIRSLNGSFCENYSTQVCGIMTDKI